MLGLLGDGSSFKALTIDDIAVAAGIKRSAFYFYFRDKEDLLEHAAEDVVALLYEQADRWWHGQGEPESRVRAALDGVTAVYAEHADLLRVITEVSSYDPDVREFWRALVERFVSATADHLRAEQAVGRAPGIDPDETAFQLVWMVERCCYVRIATGDTPPEDLARSLTRTWMALLYS
jgi:AcrR family transcriptional regulator